MHLTQEEKNSINQRIREAETETQAELVTVIAQNSDDYRYIPTLWAAVIALSFPGLLVLFEQTMPYVYPIQALLFLVLTILFQFSKIKMCLVPKYIKHARASRHAHELFYIEGLHLTNENTGLMLFVSVDEKYAEIIADKGIDTQVEESAWQDIINTFTETVRQGKTAEAYLQAVSECGRLLKEHYPAKDKNPNELPDHLIEI